MKVSWKMDDIFVGFLNNDEKYEETVEIGDHIKKLEEERQGEKESSYIQNLGESEIKVEDMEDVEKIESEKK